MMFKPNPKKQVEITFLKLFGRGHKVSITGSRITPAQCEAHGLMARSRDGLYLTELAVDGEVVAHAADRDWRASYKKLSIAVENLYAAGTAMV